MNIRKVCGITILDKVGNCNRDSNFVKNLHVCSAPYFWIGVQQKKSLVQDNTRRPNMFRHNGMHAAKVQLAVSLYFVDRASPSNLTNYATRCTILFIYIQSNS